MKIQKSYRDGGGYQMCISKNENNIDNTLNSITFTSMDILTKKKKEQRDAKVQLFLDECDRLLSNIEDFERNGRDV